MSDEAVLTRMLASLGGSSSSGGSNGAAGAAAEGAAAEVQQQVRELAGKRAKLQHELGLAEGAAAAARCVRR